MAQPTTFQPFLRFWGLYDALQQTLNSIFRFQPFLRFWQVASALLELAERGYDVGVWYEFQPFLRFWEKCNSIRDRGHQQRWVSTLLEILVRVEGRGRSHRRYLHVSTLLEILGLVCLVVVGF